MCVREEIQVNSTMTECSVGPGRMTTSDVGTSIISLADFQNLYSPFHELHLRMPAELHSFPRRHSIHSPSPLPPRCPRLTFHGISTRTFHILHSLPQSRDETNIPPAISLGRSQSALSPCISSLAFSGTDSSRSGLRSRSPSDVSFRPFDCV